MCGHLKHFLGLYVFLSNGRNVFCWNTPDRCRRGETRRRISKQLEQHAAGWKNGWKGSGVGGNGKGEKHLTRVKRGRASRKGRGNVWKSFYRKLKSGPGQTLGPGGPLQLRSNSLKGLSGNSNRKKGIRCLSHNNTEKKNERTKKKKQKASHAVHKHHPLFSLPRPCPAISLQPWADLLYIFIIPSVSPFLVAFVFVRIHKRSPS